jgi:hypothetical protein
MTISANFPNIQPSLLLDFANAQQLPPSVTFTRATTGTYYDGSTTAKAEQNLQLYSQEFNSWVATSCSATANTTTAPDGTSTADTVTVTVANAEHYIARNETNCFAGIATTVSVYAKNGTQNYIQFSVAGNGLYANFDLSTGAVGTSGSVTSTSITSVGSGWYRCVATFTPSVSGFMFIALINSASAGRLGIYTPASATTVFLWGAQVEERSAVSSYTATSTATVTNYNPVLLTAGGGQPRFDHNPTTSESLGLLIEESRTNLALRSEEFDNASIWPTSNSSVTANTAVAPDGTLTADRLIPNTTTGGHFVTQSLTVTAAVHTYSVYLKAAGYNWAVVYLTGPNVGTFFNLSNGTIGSSFVGAPTSSSITHVGNGWYRCSITATLTTSSGLRVYSTNVDGNASIVGDNFSGLFVWGAQLEAGSFATSYIPTTTAAATRAADAASMTGTNFSSWYNAGEGTLYSEAKLLAVPGGSTYPGIVKISTDSGNKLGFYTTPAATSTYFSVSANSTSSADISVAQSPVSSFLKIASVYKVNDFAASVNASTVGTDTSGIVPAVIKMDIGTYDNSWNGTIKKIAYYPIRVTNAQLQALTS